MGVNESYPFAANSSSHYKINRNHFDFQYVIGKGGFGKVWKVIFKKNLTLYALKEMSKVKVIDRKSEKSIQSERDILSKLRHPFIVNMSFSFQDYDNLYLVLDLLTGGDLRYHLTSRKEFSEEQTKFFIACVLLGLEFIHENSIIHRDIKPENLVCDENGYIRITDFGIAKVRVEENASETSGTPGYMSPEVLCGLNHSYPADFYAIGAMGYEFMKGERPYHGKTRKDIKQLVLRRQAIISSEDIPKGWSSKSADFINGLLKRKETQRLGFEGGVRELKEHQWFNGFDWDRLENKTMRSPFNPNPSGNYDKRYCEAQEVINAETLERYEEYTKRDNYRSLFNQYTFISEIEISNYIISKKILTQKVIHKLKQHKELDTSKDNDALASNPFLKYNKERIKNNFIHLDIQDAQKDLSTTQRSRYSYQRNDNFNSHSNGKVYLDIRKNSISNIRGYKVANINNNTTNSSNHQQKEKLIKKDTEMKLNASTSMKLFSLRLPSLNIVPNEAFHNHFIKVEKRISIPIPLAFKSSNVRLLRKPSSTNAMTNQYFKPTSNNSSERNSGRLTSKILSQV